MSQDQEFEGKNVDKALEKASNELNTPVENLEYDVVSYGSSGIFGLVGAKKAKIRVINQPNKSVDSDTRSQVRDLVKDAFDLDDDDYKDEPNQEIQEAVLSKKQEHAADIGKQALQRMVDFITEDAHIDSQTKDQRLIFKVEGGNTGLLIGKRGQTLEAMQYLVEKIVNKQCEQRVRLLVDVEGYLETRKANLKSMATKMAEKAKRRNKPVTIGQMNAYDRRTVHMHLKNNNAVRTQSVGEGYYRKLIIFPKKRRRGNRNFN